MTYTKNNNVLAALKTLGSDADGYLFTKKMAAKKTEIKGKPCPEADRVMLEREHELNAMIEEFRHLLNSVSLQ